MERAAIRHAIKQRINEIKVQIENTTSDYDREKLQERLAKLAGGVAVIRVGGATGSAVQIDFRGRDLDVVVETIARLLRLALAHAPRLRVLCTSQRPLDVDGERIRRLDPLRLDDAVALFVQCAASSGGNAEDTPTLRAVCERLDRMPLSIEIVSGSTAAYSVEELREMLDRREVPVKEVVPRRDARFQVGGRGRRRCQSAKGRSASPGLCRRPHRRRDASRDREPPPRQLQRTISSSPTFSSPKPA